MYIFDLPITDGDFPYVYQWPAWTEKTSAPGELHIDPLRKTLSMMENLMRTGAYLDYTSHIYIYIYMYVYTDIYLYIYTYIMIRC